MMFRMLQGRCLTVLEARSSDDFEKQIIRFGQSLGFSCINAMAVVEQSLTHSQFQSVDNAPKAYSAFYDDRKQAQADPVMQHCKHASIPIVWGQETYVSRGLGEKWEHQAQFGYASGIAVAMHLPGGKHFAMGIDSSKLPTVNPRALTRIIADLQLFAVHAQDAAFNIYFAEAPNEPSSPSLTPRELEALRWTMEGKNAWEVGEALNISERTAVFHLQNAVRKLGCSSKHQAVLKSIRLGLLS